MDEQARKWAGPVAPITDVAKIADHNAVCQLAKIYGLGLDMRDYELCRSAFADEAVVEGKDGATPIDVALPKTYEVASSFNSTQHFIGNQYVTLDGDEAVVWSYGVAHHKVKPGEQRDDIIAGVQYRDRCRRFPQGWLIVGRSITMQWMDMAPPRPSIRS